METTLLAMKLNEDNVMKVINSKAYRTYLDHIIILDSGLTNDNIDKRIGDNVV
jgi:hypothetical protein